MFTTFATLIVACAAASAPGPIAASIARHAADPLQVRAASPDDLQWSRLDRIKPGAEIVISTRTDPLVTRVFVSSDSTSLTVLNLRDPVLPRVAARRLQEVAAMQTRLLDEARLAAGFETEDQVRVSSAGIFVGGSRICEVDRILQHIARSAVTLVKATGEVHASKAAIVAGAGLGELLGLVLLASTIECRISESITGCNLQLTAPFWGPVAGGVLGYAATRHVDETIYYRRD